MHAVAFLSASHDEVGAAARRAVEATGAPLEWVEDAPVAFGAGDAPERGVGVDRCRALEGARTRFPETDLVVVRELGGATEYADVAALVRRAGELDREWITVVGAEVEGARAEAAAGLCARLVADPSAYDVLVLPGLLGAVVSDLAAGLAGGPGLVARVAHAQDAARFGAAPDPVNPAGLMLAGALMLRHLGEPDAAERLERAIGAVIRRGERVTPDVKPTPNDPSAVGTSEFADAVIEEMHS